MDWGGYCQEGNCKTCTDGQERCNSTSWDFGYTNHNDDQMHQEAVNPQTCAGGEWVSTAAFNQQEPVLNVQSCALIAIAVMVSICFLALLGVIAAVIMLK